jgi:hypothetical protein
MPIHNSETHIWIVLDALFSCTSRPSILVIVFDACTDESISTVFEYFDSNQLKTSNSSIVCIDFFVSEKDLYESFIDNFALFAYPDSKYLISIQSDIVMQEPGYDALFVGALELYSDLFMISGRGTHSFPYKAHLESVKAVLKRMSAKALKEEVTRSQPNLTTAETTENVLKLTNDLFFLQEHFGRCGVFHEHRVESEELCLYLSETVIRGPLMYFAPTLRQIGGLDWRKHRLGNDDHSAAIRGWRILGKRTAYLPVAYTSPLYWGSTRSQKSNVQKFRYIVMRISERFHHVRACDLDSKRNRTDEPIKQIRPLGNLR